MLLLAAAFVALSLTLAGFMWREGERENDLSATSLIAAMLTFALGAFAVLGDMAAAAGAGVASVALLAAKGQLHGWVARITWIELRAGLVLAAMTFILLPLLPNRPVDPLGVLNPYEIWLMTILIAAISFAGYAAVKVAGPKRGAALAAAAGGLVASTAVTLTLARIAKDNPDRVRLLSGSILLAGTVMFLRMLFVVAVLSVPLAMVLLPGLGGAALASGASAAWLMRSRKGAKTSRKDDLKFNNPFRLAEVIRFGAILTVVMALAAIAARYLERPGCSPWRRSRAWPMWTPLRSPRPGWRQRADAALALAILLAAASNTAAKSLYAWIAGGSGVGLRVAVGAGLAIACGLIAHLAVAIPVSSDAFLKF